MGGKPFKVGRFAHSLRVRLMWEHLGVDVDAMYSEDPMASNPIAAEPSVTRGSAEQEFNAMILPPNKHRPSLFPTNPIHFH